MSIEGLQAKLGLEWNAIKEARAFSQKAVMQLSSAIERERLKSSETSLIVLGSLAREECVPGSDLDWTVLIDGRVDPQHVPLAQNIRDTIQAVAAELGLQKPSPRGPFGDMVFSHDVVHAIGGEDDTNRNTTIRILLLLESVGIGKSEARQRVLTNILRRYLEEDAYFASGIPKSRAVPRFLLNDIIRYWRTIAVDFASKRRELAGEGWALRNIKLRMSRKLMFMSGVLMCFDCEMKHREQFEKCLFGPETNTLPLIELLLTDYVNCNPLDICARAFLERGKTETAREFFNAYDIFLSEMSDESVRSRLKELDYNAASDDSEFQNLRTNSHAFQKAALSFFFSDNEQLKALSQEYALF
jgi:hypothetical protein